MIKSLNSKEDKPCQQAISDINTRVKELDDNHYYRMVEIMQEERQNRPQGWTFINILKKIFGLIMVLSLFKMILFPTQLPPTDAELMEHARKNFNFTASEVM